MMRFFEDTRYRRERIFLVFGIPLVVLFVAGIFALLFFPRHPSAQDSPASALPPGRRVQESVPVPSPQAAAQPPAPVQTQTPPTPPPPVAAAEQTAPDTKAATPVPSPETDADRIAQAVRAFESGDTALAQKLIDAVDLSLARSASAWLLAGVLKEKAGDPASAMEIYSRGIASDPSPNLLYRRAVLFRSSGDLEAALRDLEKVTGDDPGDVLASNERFLLLLQMGKKEQLLAELREQNSGGKSVRESSCILCLCGLALDNGQSSEAAKLLARGKLLLAPEIFDQLLSNPVLLRHQSDPAILPFYITNLPAPNQPPP